MKRLNLLLSESDLPSLNSSERLSQDHIEQAQLSGEQKRKLYTRFGQKVLPSQYPTAEQPTVTAAEQENFIKFIVRYHHNASKPQIPMENGSLESKDLPKKLDQNKKFHQADDDLKSATLGWIEDQEKDFDKKRRKEMNMPELTTKNKTKEIVKRGKLYGKELEVVKYGESILVKRVVQFEDGIIRMECAGQHAGKWVTLTKDTALKKVSGHPQDSNSRTGVLQMPGGMVPSADHTKPSDDHSSVAPWTGCGSDGEKSASCAKPPRPSRRRRILPDDDPPRE